MPIYMDRHDVSKEVTAENVAMLHQEDLKVQDRFNCRGLTYWFDDKRKMAFCLVEAPNVESVHDMHSHAHGEVPHSIIEVDARLVESFLGRMEDPKAYSSNELIIIDEPAFRFLLSVKLHIGELNKNQSNGLASNILDYKFKVIEQVNNMQGTVVRQDGRNLLISFTNAKDAIHCGLVISKVSEKAYPYLGLSIGLDAGLPVEGNKSIFEDTIKTSKRLCELKRGFSISRAVLKMYQDEQSDSIPNTIEIKIVDTTVMTFFNTLFNTLESNFSNSELKMDTFTCNLRCSKSQIYRNSIGLLGSSLNTYLNNYRLEQSLDMMMNGLKSVSEIAFLCGFSSSSYYSKCFLKRYGISPKVFINAIEV